MKFENEITVEIDIEFEKLESILKENNFKVIEIYDLKDVYLLNKNFHKRDDYLDILNNCVLVRHIIEENKDTKYITYKYKEYNDQKEIIKQGKINCSINSIDEAKQLLEALNYEEIIKIYDHSIVYSNGIDELVVQMVNNKHIYIEIEDKCYNINRKYKNVDEMKEVISKYNIPIKNNNYFVKKAEIEMLESFKNN